VQLYLNDCCSFRYRLSPETFVFTLVNMEVQYQGTSAFSRKLLHFSRHLPYSPNILKC